MAQSGPNKDFLVQSSPQDSISSLSWSPNTQQRHIVAGSWDGNISCWQVGNNGQAMPKAQTNTGAPVLCTSYSNDGASVFAGGCKNQAFQWDLATNQTKVVGAHSAPIKECKWIPEANMLATASWDKTLCYWDLRQQNPAAKVQLPERAYCMDVAYPMLVVATAERKVQIYELRSGPSKPYQTMDSMLKFQSRSLACFPDKSGFALGSIEGRVAIMHVEANMKQKNFAFKCHRVKDEVYAVNSLAFHQRYGTFATCGSDGKYVFWDKDSKTRLKLFQRNNQPITASEFSPDGTIFAYALSYDWSKGLEYHNPKKCPPQIMLHPVQDSEIQPKKK